jgi:multidrug efflux pump
MWISDVSIRRPVLATVVNLLVVLAGVWAFRYLPVREYPDVDPPTVSVRTAYVGASPQTVENTITIPLEEALKGVEGIRTVTSTSSLGESAVSIEFESGRDMDLAANDVTNAIQAALTQLPDEAERPTVAKAAAGSRALIWLSVQGDGWAAPDLTDVAERIVKAPLQVLPGVADIVIGGRRKYAMRVWLDPDKMAAHRVDPSDVRRTILDNNLQLPAGAIEGDARQFKVLADAQIDDADVYENLIVRYDGDRPVRLRDVGRVELAANNYGTITRLNGKPTIGVGIVRQSRANELELSGRVLGMLPELRKAVPDGVTIKVAVDQTIFVKASLKEVWETLAIAFVLVVLVNLIFLRSLTTTFIASIAIPGAAVGTFFILNAFGYSINVLTLLGLVLAIGLLVDDAIVVLENVYRHQELGELPREAALRGTREVGFPVIATSVSLLAVLVPLGLLTGATGRLFREFAVTVGASIVISTFVALTLIPMLCAQFLKLNKAPGAVSRAIDAPLRLSERLYEQALDWAVSHRVAMLGLLAGSVGATWWLYREIPETLVPVEDRGQFLTIVRAPEGATLAYTDRTLKEAEALVEAIPQKEAYFAAIGLSIGGPASASNGLVYTRLVPWEDREVTQQQIVAGLFPKYTAMPGALLFPVNPQSLGQGSLKDLEFIVKSSMAELDEFAGIVESLLEHVRGVPGLVNVDADLRLDDPQVRVVFDRQRAADLGVSVRQVTEALQLMVAEGKTDEFILRNKQYDVIASLFPSRRSQPDQLGRIQLRNREGDMVPLDNLVRHVTTAAPPALMRHGLERSATISGNLAPGATLGPVLRDVQRLAERDLPEGYTTALGGASREFAEASSELLLTFLFALVFVYLVLSAQFENFVHSLTIMLSVPLATGGALATLWATGQTMNLYSQIGMVLLIGLVAKNAILLVDYGNQRRARGAPLVDAIVEAGKTRFRPIVMTSVTSILGALPLVLAAGAGAESRHPIGAAVVGGLLFSTVFTLVIIPDVYILLTAAAERNGLGMNPPAIDLDEGVPAE